MHGGLVKINTTRFGELVVNKQDILNFEDGLLGFEDQKKFFIVDPGDQTLVLWLQSIKDPSVAFPILEPRIFIPDYSVKLLPAELNSLELTTLADAAIYTILTIPSVVTDMSANLKAPIVINNKTKKSRQIVLQDSKLEVQRKMYVELKRYIATYSSDDSIRTKVEISEEPANTDTVTTDPATEENSNTNSNASSIQKEL
jgi:flagellar assembly factor FliW